MPEEGQKEGPKLKSDMRSVDEFADDLIEYADQYLDADNKESPDQKEANRLLLDDFAETMKNMLRLDSGDRIAQEGFKNFARNKYLPSQVKILYDIRNDALNKDKESVKSKLEILYFYARENFKKDVWTKTYEGKMFLPKIADSRLVTRQKVNQAVPSILPTELRRQLDFAQAKIAGLPGKTTTVHRVGGGVREKKEKEG